MPSRSLLGGLMVGLLWGSLAPAPAAGGDLLGWLRGDHVSYTAAYLSAAGPGQSVGLGQSVGPGAQLPLQAAVAGPSPGYIPATATYNWGYFGAPYRAVHFTHKSYYGDCSWWRYHRH